jgi:hypothetical protein
MVHALTGQAEAARGELAEMEQLETHGYLPAFHIAGVYSALGEHDAAFAWADRAIEQREPWMIQRVRFFPNDLLRGDSRYAALLKKMNLA